MSRFGFDENGNMIKIEDIDAVCENIKYLIKESQGENERLREENEKLKSAHYATDAIKEMQTQLEEMRKDYRRGFPIDEATDKKARDWMREHDEKKHKFRKSGAIGGSYSWNFTPTSIGTLASIKCSCGEEFYLGEV